MKITPSYLKRSEKISQYPKIFKKISQDLRSEKISPDLRRSTKICWNIWRSGKIYLDLARSWDLSKYAITKDLKSCSPYVFLLDRLAPPKSTEMERPVLVEMFICETTAEDWKTFSQKEKWARHLKKICKTFVKDLKYWHLIKIWKLFSLLFGGTRKPEKHNQRILIIWRNHISQYKSYISLIYALSPNPGPGPIQ